MNFFLFVLTVSEEAPPPPFSLSLTRSLHRYMTSCVRGHRSPTLSLSHCRRARLRPLTPGGPRATPCQPEVPPRSLWLRPDLQRSGPQGSPADGACACVRRPLSPGPCVVWPCVHVCGLVGPLLICPRPANGLPSDQGCLLYFCLHQLNSDRPLPPAGPNQSPAPPLSSPWRHRRSWDQAGRRLWAD